MTMNSTCLHFGNGGCRLGADNLDRLRGQRGQRAPLSDPDYDPELQAALGRDGLMGLDRLLTAQQGQESLPCREIGALVKLIAQATAMGQGDRRL